MAESAGTNRQIVYLGAFRFPDGDAAAARVLGIGQALRAAGFTVTFAGGESAGRPADAAADGGFEFDGFRYHPQRELDGSGRSPGARLGRYLSTGRRTARWLQRRFESADRPAAVVLYNGLAGYHLRVGSVCRRHRVPLIADLTEWYSPEQCAGGRFGLQRWDLAYTMRRLVPRADGLLPISSFLAETYKQRGCRVLRVPPLVDLSAAKWPVTAKPPDRAGIRLVYAGNPGRKDALATILRALIHRVPPDGDVRLRLLGMTAEGLANYCAGNSLDARQLGASVETMGRVPQSVVPSHLAAADYSVLLRPNARYSRAGFPTKVVESLASGTGVIANPVGDLEEYVSDGTEGLLVSNDTVDALLGGLDRAVRGGPELADRVGAAARRRARQTFDYRNHVEALNSFLHSIVAAAGRRS